MGLMTTWKREGPDSDVAKCEGCCGLELKGYSSYCGHARYWYMQAEAVTGTSLANSTTRLIESRPLFGACPLFGASFLSHGLNQMKTDPTTPAATAPNFNSRTT